MGGLLIKMGLIVLRGGRLFESCLSASSLALRLWVRWVLRPTCQRQSPTTDTNTRYPRPPAPLNDDRTRTPLVGS
jgi:hypothetical protein